MDIETQDTDFEIYGLSNDAFVKRGLVVCCYYLLIGICALLTVLGAVLLGMCCGGLVVAIVIPSIALTS